MLRGRSLSALGDPRWVSASPHFATYAPLVVLSLLVLSVIQIALGTVWVSKTPPYVTFTGMLQPVILPSLSFFNAIPSAQLHIIARSNKPMMVICFSSPMALLYLASAIVSLVSCSTGTESFQRTECPVNYDFGGPSQPLWNAVVALWLCSAVGYALHVAMAWKVRRVLKKNVRNAGGDVNTAELVVVDPETKARMEQEAVNRWTRLAGL